MENKIKIVILISFVFFFTCCTQQKNSELNNSEISFGLRQYFGKVLCENENFIFEVPCIYCLDEKPIRFINVKTINNDTLYLRNVIDTSSFRLLGLDSFEKEKIRNRFYLDGRMLCYYRDKNNLYAFLDKENPEFLLLGLWKDVILLGGNYIRIKNRIYSKGLFIPHADLETFHTMDIPQFHNKSEWSVTVGLDKNHIYLDEKIMDKLCFNKIIFSNDSLKNIYFPKKSRINI